MRILFISRWYPYPPDNGSKIRIYNMLRQLSRRYEISLVSFREADDQVDSARIEHVRGFCSEVRVVPYREYNPSSPGALLGLLSTQPRYLIDTHSREMDMAIRDACRSLSPDLVLASQMDTLPYALRVGGPIVLEELELAVHREAIRRSRTTPGRIRARLSWAKLASYLRSTLPRVSVCTVVSERERQHLLTAAPAYQRVAVLPNAVDVRTYDFASEAVVRNTLVFCGSLTYRANYDALLYFLTEIYPLIVQRVPDVKLYVTGSTTGVDLASLPDQPGVIYTGRLTDVRPLVASCSASVVPLRVGGGTRLKILESMALGTPVVSTSKGAEGLDASDNEHVFITDSAPQFARRTVELMQSPETRLRMGWNARRLVEDRYDWAVIGQRLDDLLERAVSTWSTQAHVSRECTG